MLTANDTHCHVFMNCLSSIPWQMKYEIQECGKYIHTTCDTVYTCTMCAQCSVKFQRHLQHFVNMGKRCPRLIITMLWELLAHMSLAAYKQKISRSTIISKTTPRPTSHTRFRLVAKSSSKAFFSFSIW